MNKSNEFQSSQRLAEMGGRQIIGLCATVTIWGSGHIIAEQN